MAAITLATQNISYKEQILTLTNQRAVYWGANKSLILSDLHIGKAAHFQKSGIPISVEVLLQDLERLKYLILHYKPENLIIVGDLFHAEYNTDLDVFKTWLQQFNSLKIQLIKGNHDRLPNAVFSQFNIETFKSELIINSLKFVHDSVDETSTVFTISGHIHPGVLIKGKAKQRFKLPCYLVTKHQLVLPAFSLFTGYNTQHKIKKATTYPFTETDIFKF